MGTKEDIKSLIVQSKWTLKEVAEELSKRTNKYYSSPNLSQKLSSENLKYKEAKLIAEILGYNIKFEKNI
ncbi:MAG: hypothetical protein K2F57_03225 [Candidatus Gastranaerophilales bacterium]|nr:hypothetical protein [Candidatus Gastranaerophilales bacterium]